ncbi:ABC transporter permease subunit [Cellulomonas sp. JZ18]|uniref:amino acid ABC transporter permease n=1 Tax=Cellulomonas sp. JZ18 TaxID=2654191 RepID=UPI0012D47019|nr:amino acid ABC transporter permease [Cellulomonas sp. JZ18]QGQ19734.1 ABC transporter permease subunit [Cellulomonas sp. JZ18]
MSVDLSAPAGRARMSPRRRARVSRGVQYVVLLAVLALLLATADWSAVGQTIFNPAAAGEIVDRLPRAFYNTVRYTLAAFAVGLSLGTLLALMRLSSVAPYRWIATTYVEFFRGIPALLVVIAVAYAVPIAFGVSFTSIVAIAAIALGSVSAAYISETVRAGIEAVPKGQVEAARSLGMSHTRTMVQVVLPQAFRTVLPPLTNEVLLLTKDTSLLFIIGQTPEFFELTKVGRDALSTASGGLTGLFVIGACYLVITIPLGLVARRLERRTGGRA